MIIEHDSLPVAADIYGNTLTTLNTALYADGFCKINGKYYFLLIWVIAEQPEIAVENYRIVALKIEHNPHPWICI